MAFTSRAHPVFNAMLRNFLLLSFIALCRFAVAQPLHTYGWTFYDTSDKSITSNHVTDICFDRKGRAWVTTGSTNLSMWEAGKWRIIKADRRDSSQYFWLRNMSLMKDNRLVISGIPGYLAYYHTETGRWEYTKMPESGLQPLYLYTNDQDLLLVGTMKGLYALESGKWRHVINNESDVMGISPQENGDVLVCLRCGIYRLKDQKNKSRCVQPFRIRDGAFYEAVTDKKGRLWTTGFDKLSIHQLRDTAAKTFDTLPESIYYNFNGKWTYITHNASLLPDGRPIFTTQFGAHIAVYNDPGWETHSVPLNGEFDGIGCIRYAPDSSIWLGTWHHGVVVFSPEKSKHKKVKVDPVKNPAPGQQQQPGQGGRVNPPPSGGPKTPGPRIPEPRMRED